jgi:hypothetical protein
MPPPFFPDSYTLVDANAKRTSLALSVLKLFKFGLVPTRTTLVASLDLAEADYDDYTPITITAWLAAVATPGGGSQISAATQQFTAVADQVVPNTIGGYWIELAGGTVVLIRQFDVPVPMVNAGNFIQVAPTIIVPNGIA